MESTDDSLDSKVIRADECQPEIICTSAEEDQSGEQVYAYLVGSSGTEDATIYVNPEGLSLNGQSLILTQNDGGNEIILLVSEDPDSQPLDQTFAHASVLHSDEVNFEDSLKEHNALVVDEQSQGLEFIKTGDEESHAYIENSEAILNSEDSPINVESPLWSVSASEQLKNDGTEMLFIPNPTVVLAPEETKHPKLMQLACIALKTDKGEEEPSLCQEENTTEPQLLPKCDEKKIFFDLNSKSSMRLVDNTVSVIHSTGVQDVLLDNQLKLNSDKNENEILYPHISNVSIHGNRKQSEESEENRKLLLPDHSNEKSHLSEDNSKFTEDDNSPINFTSKSEILDVQEDEDNHTSVALVNEEESVRAEDDSKLSATELASDVQQEATSSENKVPTHEFDVFDEDMSDDQALADSTLPFLAKKFGSKLRTPKIRLLQVSLQDDVDCNQQDLCKSNKNQTKNDNEDTMSDSIIADDDEHNATLEDADEPENLSSIKEDVNSKITTNVDELGVSDSKFTTNPDKLEESVSTNDISKLEVFIPVDQIKEIAESAITENNNTADKSINGLLSRNDEEVSNNETLVKPPKITYTRKKYATSEDISNIREKIELFSGDDPFTECDKEINEVEECLNCDQPKESSNTFESDDHLLLSNVQMKVSATYDRKKKFLPIKQGLRSHTLRPRIFSSNSPLKNGSSEISDTDSKGNSFDSNNSDNMHWADVLLKTTFQPVTDGASTSRHPKETSTPVLSPEQQRRKLNKYKRDFDRLLNSSPIPAKTSKTVKKHISRKGKKVIQARFLKSNNNRLPAHRLSKKRKEAKIRYLYVECPKSNPDSSKKEMYSCSSCNFLSMYVDNLMEHLKYCSNRQPLLDYKVNDMDKRQRIRGEEITNTVNSALKQIRNDLRSALMEDDLSMSFHNREEERDTDNIRKRKKYGYGEDDVVWVKFKDRFWPALVCDIKGSYAYVKLISYPEEEKCLKVKHENIRTFDDSKWNLLCLNEAESLPHNEVFVKAVQSCERFISKKFLGFHITGKAFFSVRDEVDFATDSASSDSNINEDTDSEEWPCPETMGHARKARYEELDIQKIQDHILQGKCDDYVLDIYYKRRHSKKHTTFFRKENSELRSRPWFGPCEDTQMQEDLFRHFRDIFMERIGREVFFVSYICQVWIPEAIVQAISVVQGIPLEDAEILFESEEDSLDLEEDIEDIIQKYS